MKVKIGLVQMSMTEDNNKNLDKAVQMITQAAEKGAQIVCLPELFTSPYFPQEEHTEAEAEKIPGPTSEALARAAKENKIVLIGGSVYEKAEKLYNTSLVIDQNGKILGKYRKVHIPHDKSFYEKNYFSAGDDYQVFDTRYGKIGVLICFDQWYPEAARAVKLMGADMLFYPTAIGNVNGVEQSEGNWQEAWEGVQRGHAIANSMVVAAVNRVGVEKDMQFWGGSFVSDQFGKILAHGDEKEDVLIAECDLELAREIEEGWGFLRNRRPDTYKN